MTKTTKTVGTGLDNSTMGQFLSIGSELTGLGNRTTDRFKAKFASTCSINMTRTTGTDRYGHKK